MNVHKPFNPAPGVAAISSPGSLSRQTYDHVSLDDGGDPPDWLERGYGTGPRCIECRKNVAGCLCNVEEPDVMGVDDMRRVMPELFESGWGFSERCAYLMGGAK